MGKEEAQAFKSAGTGLDSVKSKGPFITDRTLSLEANLSSFWPS